MSKRSGYAAAIFLVIIMYSALPVSADADLEIIRLGFDQIIEEGGGINYIRINRPGLISHDIWNARPKLGTLDANRTVEVMAREEAIKEVGEKFLEILPELEKSVGLRFWSTIIMWNEEPPALYIGLYEPTESQLRSVAGTMNNVTKSCGVIIRFYEALSPKDLEDELREASKSLSKYVAGESGQWDHREIPIPMIGFAGTAGALEVVVNYTQTGRTYPDDEYVSKVIKAVRGVVGYRIPIIFTLPQEVRVTPDISYEGGQTFLFPFIIMALFLATASYIAFRRMRRRVKMSLETAH